MEQQWILNLCTLNVSLETHYNFMNKVNSTLFTAPINAEERLCLYDCIYRNPLNTIHTLV